MERSCREGQEGRDVKRPRPFGRPRFQDRTSGQSHALLRGGDRRTALAVLLDPAEIPEAGTVRFNNLSPVSYALAKADAEGLAWVIVLNSDRLRLYPTAVGIGVGRRGRTETYVEVHTSLLADEHLAYLWLLFSAEGLDAKGAVTELLDASKRFAGDLAVQLRERIYKEVIPRMARAIADARRLKNASAEDLDLTYRMALTVLFRLLFVAYASSGGRAQRPALRRPRLLCGPTEETEGTSLRTAQSCRPVRHTCSENRL